MLKTPLPELTRLLSEFRLGFSPPEIERLREYFSKEGRDPTLVELAGIAQSWSEHCSYKSSKIWIKKYLALLTDNARSLAMGDAGVMPIDEEWAYALRIESHNHPSAIEPYGGAATGIGGILRDVLAMGAKPVALADPLFFGPMDLPRKDLPDGVKHPRYLFQHVVSGIADYGNRVGVPTVSGSLTFDRSYIGNPLVNVGCVGLLRRKDLVKNRVGALGEKLVLAGGLTGRDGIGGVSFASKELSGKSEKESRPAVQLGNPIMKEPLIHAVLAAVEAGLVSGMKDLGGGGLATSSGELVSAGGFGSILHLDRVPVREKGLEPWEIWVSESQERMLLSVKPENVPAVETLFHLHEVPVSVIGEVAEAPWERLYWKGKLIARLQVPFRVDPILLERPVRKHGRSHGTPLPAPTNSWEDILSRLLLSYDGCSREPVVRLYDHEVQGRTEVAPVSGDVRTPTHSDATILRIDPRGPKGLALAVASLPFVGAIDPEVGGSEAVVEAVRNLYATGARPDALTDCLNFGNPEDPAVMGDFESTLRGLATAARGFGMAVPSGNVSFYNLGFGSGIPPTPVVLAVGIHPDVDRVVTTSLHSPGNLLYLLGETDPSLGGSLYQRIFGGHETSLSPSDVPTVRAMGTAIGELARQGWVRSCHDLSEGGLGVALPEMAFGRGLGFDVTVPEGKGLPAWRALVAEGTSRWILEVEPRHSSQVESALSRFAFRQIGKVTPSEGIYRAEGKIQARLDLAALYPQWRDFLRGER
ncbi:MAG: phosphoribosylformylglycinamidine synthase subunit PurL [Candidatus Thermoplasmatota archaeon]|nr:phosphoribosylformylglycinamidine synthase subunit PurL [Candidatus Thermoplasmatota archaeon]